MESRISVVLHLAGYPGGYSRLRTDLLRARERERERKRGRDLEERDRDRIVNL